MIGSANKEQLPMPSIPATPSTTRVMMLLFILLMMTMTLRVAGDADDEGAAERIIQIAETRQGSSDHRARPTQLNNTTQYRPSISSTFVK